LTSPATEREPQDIHDWFGLTYSNYLVLPRSLMQSMPTDWQHRATALFDEMHAAFANVDWPQYKVLTGKWCYLDDLSAEDRKRLGIVGCCDNEAADDRADHRCTYYDADGEEIDQHTACIFAPGEDPIPHYDRGRTHVQRVDQLDAKPAAEAGA
jgi:hypothetical protein